MDDHTFLKNWVAANGVAESIGLGTTFVLGMLAAPWLEGDHGVVGILGLALVAVALGMFLEGVVVGWAQGLVLERRRPELVRRRWVNATAAGAGIAWLVGMIPSTAMALAAGSGPSPQMQEPTAFVQLLLAAGLGLVTGPILGVAQWTELRRRLPRATHWLWANALAWALGMPAIFAGMEFVPWTGPPLARALAIYAVCLVAGLIVGTVHGVVLMRMTSTTGRTATT